MPLPKLHLLTTDMMSKKKLIPALVTACALIVLVAGVFVLTNLQKNSNASVSPSQNNEVVDCANPRKVTPNSTELPASMGETHDMDHGNPTATPIEVPAEDNNDDAPYQPTTHNITIYNCSLSASELTIRPGDTVKWTNLDAGQDYTITCDGMFDSGPLLTNQEFSHTFTSDEKGLHEYSSKNGLLATATITVE